MADFLFYVAGALALLFALGVVLASSPMLSVIALLGSFFCLALIYLLAGFQFLAAVQILVYAGAILVLFLFVIMLLNLADKRMAGEAQRSIAQSSGAKLAAIVAVAAGTLGLIAAQRSALPAPKAVPGEGIDDIHALAAALFGRYALPFEAASVLLLATMVAVMTLAKRQRKGRGGDA